MQNIDTEAINFEAIKQFGIQDWKLGVIHGYSHWQRVERNGLLLATPEVNITVVRIFAYLHDKCRESDGEDIEHGKRAANMLPEIRYKLLKQLTDEEFALLSTACELHTTTLKTGNITIDTCFDADRLDLERVGIIPNPKRMATINGKYYAKNLKKFYKLAKQHDDKRINIY